MRKWLDIRSFSPKEQTDFWVNCLIGMGIAVAFILLEYTVWGQKNINLQMDFFVQREAARAAERGPEDKELLAFIDIDDPAYKSWGRPSLTPRDKVAELIALAASGGAKMVISDMYFAEPDYTPALALNQQEKPLTGQERDARLRQVLTEIRERGQTKVFLPIFPYADGSVRKFLFDDLVDQKTIFQGIPFSLVSRYDGVVRYWRPGVIARGSTAQENTMVWSLPLLAAVVAKGNLGELELLARELTNPLTAGAVTEPVAFHLQNEEGPRTVYAYANGLDTHNYHRIRYLLVPEGMTKLNLQDTNLYNSTWKVSARGTVASPEKAREFFRDRIVIIGNSSPDWADKYLTPLGEMPGMYIQGNIINTIVHLRQIEKPPLVLYCLVQMLVVLLASYAFLHFHPFLSHMVVTFILLLICWLAYQFFLQTGIFINILFSLMGIGLHELLAETSRVLNRRQEIIEKIMRRFS